MVLNNLPSGWSVERLNAYNELTEAAFSYVMLDTVITKLGINTASIVQDRADVANLIKNVLLPRLASL